MTAIGIMIEGQENLTWERWLALAEAVEKLGFESLFRSDHLVDTRNPWRKTLALWPSLTALALKTERIRFGVLVSPMTFRHPAMVAKSAASVSLLANGRLDLGLGAGWNEFEHHMVSLPYPPFAGRLQMLDEGTTVMKALWSGFPANFRGKHYQLYQAYSNPKPAEPLPIIMGGKGSKTLQIVAKHADEWNFTYDTLDAFKRKSAELDAACEAVGRDPAGIRRSVMMPYVVGRDETAVQERIDAVRHTFPDLPGDLRAWQEAGYFGGSPTQLIAHLQAYVAAGASRFMLQHNVLNDLDSLQLLAAEVLPYF